MGGKLVWDKKGERIYETGVDRGVLYPATGASGAYADGIAWNGLSNVTERPSGAEATAIYADNIKYLNLISAEDFAATVEAYTYPDEFGVCDGTAEPADGMKIGQQPRKQFGLSYRTKIGNDSVGETYGYKIHIIYGAYAAPSEKAYNTINDSPEAITFSWELSTTPIEIEGYKPTAYVVLDSTKIPAAKLTEIENILYGVDADTEAETPAVSPRLPLPDELITIINRV